MLKAALQYSYINSKLHALKSRLLDQSDYTNLMQSQGINGILECLRSTPYTEGLINTPHTYTELSVVYYKNLFSDYNKLINNSSGIHRLLIHHLYRRYELENIKVILRMICYEMMKKQAHTLLFPFDRYQGISVDELLESKDFFDFIKRLKGTWYFDPLDNSAYRFEKERETFPLEMALDLRYYEILWKIVSSLKGRDKRMALSLIGAKLDMINILWIIRFKENYQFLPEEILNYSLTSGIFIDQKKRKSLAYSIDRKSIVENLKNTPYEGIIKGIEDLDAAHSCLLKYIIHLAKKNWTGSPFQIGVLLDYLLFKEIEVRNLVIITEAKKINSSMQNIKAYLVNVTF